MRTLSRALVVSPTSATLPSAHQAMERAFAPHRCVGIAASSSAACGPSAPSAASPGASGSSFSSFSSSSSSFASAAPFSALAFAFCCFSSARFLRLLDLFFTSAVSWQRQNSSVLPEPWHARTSKPSDLGVANCRPSAMPWPSGRGTAPWKAASCWPSLALASGESAQSRRNLSAAPAARRVCAALSARDQTSTLCSAMVCRQSCSSMDQMRMKRSLEALTRRAAASAPGAGAASQKSTAVTWSTWPRNRATPLSAATSQTTTSVSPEPEARSWPARSKARQEMKDLWPWKVCSSAPSSKFQSRTLPSA
mmetsp:Transcript_23748/g.74760  ORF Transcript_23748/g.74760 Transcript_23748/m.74760 type:complete len:309 (+) Transcript_23748:1652-2578(+)